MPVEDIGVWTVPPDWADGLLEGLEWQTTLLKSVIAYEQRFSTRLSPRQNFTVNFTVHDQERTHLELLTLRLGASPFYLPVWHDGDRLVIDAIVGDTLLIVVTTDTQFEAGRTVMIWSDPYNYEVAAVLAVSSTEILIDAPLANNWPKGTRIYPVKKCKIASPPQTTRRGNRAFTTAIQFQSLEPNPSVATIDLSVYNGDYVLEMEPNDGEDLQYTIDHELYNLDNTMGLQSLYDVVNEPVQAFNWWARGRAAHQKLRALLYTLDGRRVPIWVPTYYADLELVYDIANGDTVITVKRCGYTDLGGPFINREHICFLVRGGIRLYRQITGAALVGDYEQLALDTAILADIPATAVKRISFMARCRQDADLVELEHHTNSKGLTTAKTVFRAMRDSIAPDVPVVPAGFTVGAVALDGNQVLWNLPQLFDGPTGLLSYWIYNPPVSDGLYGAHFSGPISGDGTYDAASAGFIYAVDWALGSIASSGTDILIPDCDFNDPISGQLYALIDVRIRCDTGVLNVQVGLTGLGLTPVPVTINAGEIVNVGLGYSSQPLALYWTPAITTGVYLVVTGGGTGIILDGGGIVSIKRKTNIGAAGGPILADPLSGDGAFSLRNYAQTPRNFSSLLIADASRAAQTVITTQTDTMSLFSVGDLASLIVNQEPWNDVWNAPIVAVSAFSVTLDYDTTGYPPYDPSLNTGANILQVQGGVNILDISNATQAVVTYNGPHGIAAGTTVEPLFINQDEWSRYFRSGAIFVVLAVTDTTLTLDINTTQLPPYQPSSTIFAQDNSIAFFEVYNGMFFYIYDGFNGPSIESVDANYLNAYPPGVYTNVIAAWKMDEAARHKKLDVYFGDELQFRGYMYDNGAAFDIRYSIVPTDWGYDPPQGPPPLTDQFGFWTILHNTFGYVAEFYFASNQYLDLSDAANRAKFHDGNNKPVDLGATGELPTGLPPDVYAHLDRTPPDPYVALAADLKGLRIGYPGDGSWLYTPMLDHSGVDLLTGSQITVSLWMFGGAWGMPINTNYIEVDIEGGYVEVTLRNDTDLFRFELTIPFTDMVNLRFVVNTNHPIGSKVILALANNVILTPTITQDTVDNLQFNWVDPGSPYTGFFAEGSMVEIWVDNVAIDPTNLFIDGSGNPVDLGANGELVTGTAPLMYFTLKGSEAADQLMINRGVGGTFAFDGSTQPQLLPPASQFLVNKARPTGPNLRLNLEWLTFDVAPTSPAD